MYGWSWLLLWLVFPTLLAIAFAHPWLIGLVVVGFFAQRFLPDPWTWLRTSRRARSLRVAVDVNAENAQARRDLAMLLLERRRPKQAVKLLEEAARREPDSAEVSYLQGVALLGAGDAAGAIPKLDFAVRKEPKLRYGDPFLKAGEAYLRLDKTDEALVCLEKFTAMNGSSIEGWVRLAQARGRKGDVAGKRAALDEAARTFAQLPAFQRRRQWGWRLKAFVT